ncbi:hypothetical protein HPB50_006322 [Hyalomma asiaticum]|uniref:Uncharacterized protein n=1 Tax=Hyalomma asiaticum TaxID=266040 RepID=A0ACB7TF50_HYAAI|nr:hypothetical protein HPB50_006322 [Hyalomma asiaticum]
MKGAVHSRYSTHGLEQQPQATVSGTVEVFEVRGKLRRCAVRVTPSSLSRCARCAPMSAAILGLEFGKPQAPPSMNGGDNPDNNEGQRSRPEADDEDGPPPAKRCRHRKTVGFDSVTVYYFQRMQGFTCVPSQGGSTLGMSSMHVEKRTFSLRQHAHERRRLHFGDVDCSNTSSSSSLSPDDTAGSSSSAGDSVYQGGNSTLGAGEDTAEEDVGDDEGEPLSYLQPVPTRQRRALLRASGVRKIDALEKEECRDIRASREFCGCACKGRCLPETCSCSIAGISCQVGPLAAVTP